MVLRKLVLHRFKRFFLTGVEHFVFIPTENITVIAWSNGMGKSSLLSQMSPLPADLKKDYNEGGYKIIEFVIGTDEYILSSGYIGKSKHSFVKNGIELNQGGTSAVQKQLAEEHLKITPSIFNIMLGVDQLTTMSPSIRKQWFTMLSPVDYTYSIRVWNELRSRARDIVGSIKIAQDDLVKKSAGVIDEKQLSALQEESSKLERNIERLADGLVHLDRPSYIENIDSVFSRLDSNNSTRSDLIERYGNLTLETVNVMLGNTESELKSTNDELMKKNELMKLLGSSSDATEQLLEDTNQKIANITQQLNQPYESWKYERLSTRLPVVQDNVNKAIRYLTSPEIAALPIGQELEGIRANIEQYRATINSIKGSIVILEKNIKELENDRQIDIVCPKCHHGWRHDSTRMLDENKKSLEETRKRLDSVTTELNKCVSIERSSNIKLETMEMVVRTLNDELLQPYFSKLESDYSNYELLYNNLLVDINRYGMLDQLYRESEKLNKEIEVKRESIRLAREAGVSTIGNIEGELEKLTTKRVELIQRHKDLRLYRSVTMDIESDMDNVQKYIDYRMSEYSKSVFDKRNEIIRSHIATLKLKLSDIKKSIDDSSLSSNVIKTLQERIEDNKARLSVLHKMLDALSPDSGLIAKSINSFLNTYLSEMNSIINSVWSYNMEILPCQVDDGGDLNYKFRVKVDHNEVIEDISKLSSSMQEIVNLAFKIIFVKYLGISHFPLILDEFGRTMDAEHRVAAFDVIDRVLSHSFNQIMLVCHFESMYSRFVNADFLELKESRVGS